MKRKKNKVVKAKIIVNKMLNYLLMVYNMTIKQSKMIINYKYKKMKFKMGFKNKFQKMKIKFYYSKVVLWKKKFKNQLLIKIKFRLAIILIK